MFWNTTIANIIGIIIPLFWEDSDTYLLYLPLSTAVTLLVHNISKSQSKEVKDHFMSGIFSRFRRKKNLEH